MNDAELRTAVIGVISDRTVADPDTLLIEELGLRHGAVRLDIAVLNGRLEGYELKSERDTLARLSRQAETYGEVLDRVTLVAASRHVSAAKNLVPEWWGLVEAVRSPDGDVVLISLRPPEANPGLDPIVLAKLLWRPEALAALEELGQAEGLRSARRADIYARLAQCLSLDELRSLVRNRLRTRSDWRPAGPGREDQVVVD